MEVSVITPSVGVAELGRAVGSVGSQTLNKKHSVRHIVVADGKQYLAEVTKQAMNGWKGEGLTPRIYAIPDNTGRDKWNGHKIYAYYSQMLQCDYLFLLDEDNSYDSNHCETLIPIAEKHGFAWSMRKVYTKQGEYLGVDRQESIGVQLNGAGYALVDTSCWCLRADNIPMLYHFLEQWSGDRRFTRAMINKYGSLQQGMSDIVTANYYCPDESIDFFRNICVP
jgi:hypothetical protein